MNVRSCFEEGIVKVKINNHGAPPGSSSGADSLEPLDPPGSQSTAQTTKRTRFSEMLSESTENQPVEHAASSSTVAPPAAGSNIVGGTRQALEQIARQANLTNPEAAREALRQSAEFMIRARLGTRYQNLEESERLVAELSEFVAADPLLKAKLLTILTKIKAE